MIILYYSHYSPLPAATQKRTSKEGAGGNGATRTFLEGRLPLPSLCIFSRQRAEMGR